MNKLESGEVRFLSVPFEMEPLLHEIDPVLQSQAWKKYVFPIYMAYNGKGRKDALPMKF